MRVRTYQERDVPVTFIFLKVTSTRPTTFGAAILAPFESLFKLLVWIDGGATFPVIFNGQFFFPVVKEAYYSKYKYGQHCQDLFGVFFDNPVHHANRAQHCHANKGWFSRQKNGHDK